MKQSFAMRSACSIFVFALLAAWAGPLTAAPVYTVVADRKEVGVERFLEDLSRIWKELHVPAPGRLAVTYAAEPKRRLRLLSRGRGQFAIIDTAVATALLTQHEGLAAVALLWPGYLHAVTRAPIATLALPIRKPVKVAPSARYVYDALMEWKRDRRAKISRVTLLSNGEDFLQDFEDDEEVMLFSAPAPFAELVELMEEDSDLRLLSVSPRLAENLRLLNPWLQTEVLAAGTYPRMNRRRALPVRHLVMVGRKDLPEAIVRKMLITLYDKTSATAPYNPLFGALGPKLNQVYAQLFPYHPVTAKKLGFLKK
jgi:hypothetical protein